MSYIRYPIHLKTYDEAEQVLLDFTKNETWLKSMLWNKIFAHLENSDWPVEYRELLYHANRVKGVAKKMLASKGLEDKFP